MFINMIDLSLYKKIGRLKIFKSGDIVFLQNASGEEMYVVMKGEFGVYLNTFTDFPTQVAKITEGAFFGEMSVIDGSSRSATIISEEQGQAIIVDRSNFRELIESSPEMSAKILSTLSGRAESTAQAARDKGKKVEELPEELKSPVQNPDTDFDNMVALAKRIRELNVLLSGEEKQEEIKIKEASTGLTLLPPGHKIYNEIDDNITTKLLSDYSYVCPYCRKGFKDKMPIFSRLVWKETTNDQRTKYANFNLLLYMNIVCPNCNFCDTYQEFSKEGIPARTLKITGNQFQNVEEFTGFPSSGNRSVMDAILSYHLSLKCLELIPNSALRMAKTWQRLYWLYNDHDDHGAAKQAAINSLMYYSDYMETNGNNLAIVDYMTLNIIIAELNLALGKTVEAIEAFEKNCNVAGYQTHDLALKSIHRVRKLRGA